jgi:hypothetical protein
VKRRNGGYALSEAGELRLGPALRCLDSACLELEELGYPPEFALVVLLRGVGERIAVEHG